MKQKEDMRKYWLRLSHACGQGSRSAVSLVRAFGGAREVFFASESELEASGVRMGKRTFARLCEKNTADEEDILRWCDDKGVSVLYPGHDKYPKSLLSLRDAPMVLYCIGQLPDFDNTFSCAVVGTRSMSEYGRKTAYTLGGGLALGGACLVSGLALGVDGMAMAGAVDAGGVSVAVLGCGIDVVYPPQHEQLLERIIERGAVITEYPPGTSPAGGNFPTRNRIISGISQAVCVVEGNMRSGSLITARHALFQGRDLYAVPGKIGDDGAEGTNYLIKQGASAVTCADDILAEYEFLYPHTINLGKASKALRDDAEAEERMGVGSRRGKRTAKKEKQKEETAQSPFGMEPERAAPRIDFDLLGETELSLYRSMLPEVPMLPEELCKNGMPISKVMSALTMLEIAGAVEAGAGGYFLRHADDGEVGEPAVTEEDCGL